MRALRIALVLVLFVAVAVVLRAPPPPAPAVTLTCAFERGPAPQLLLRFAGTATHPDGTLLRLRLWRLHERRHFARLEPILLVAGGSSLEVRAGRFSHDDRVTRPGIYRAVLDLPEGPREFDFHLWDDAFVPTVLDQREPLDDLIVDVRRMAARIQRAALTERQWNREGVKVLFEYLNLEDRVERSAALGTFYPAAAHDLDLAVRLIKSAFPHFFWTPDGLFGGAFNASTASWVPGPDGRPFDFNRMVVFLEDARGVARREASLWTLKESRRVIRHDPVLGAARARRPDIRTLLVDMEASLDRIEAGIRGEAREHPVPPPPPTPTQFTQAIARLERAQAARKILQQADQLWDQLNDRQSPLLYRTLQNEYGDVLDELGARVRVGNRARAESE